ncbi:hypothetical protein [Auritidibacter sp. NML100628]|nr:hypothetical protein [Auritidibacter sp. NML100628]
MSASRQMGERAWNAWNSRHAVRRAPFVSRKSGRHPPAAPVALP